MVDIMDPIPIASSEFLNSLSLWVHPKSRLLICFDKNCRHAISPNGSHPTNHLRDKHNIPLSRRKGLSKVLAKLELKSPDGAAPLPDGSPEERRLRSYDGFSCLHCRYRTINLTLIIQHYSQGLPEYPQYPRRSTRRADIEAYFEYVYLQAWACGSSRVYWIVERDGQLTRPTVPVGQMRESALSLRDKNGQEQQDLIRSVQEREHERNRVPTASVQTTAAAGSATTYAEQRPWLERTRWEITYRNRDRSLHRCLIQTPYLSSYSRPDAPPYLLASTARVPSLFADIVSPHEDEMKIIGILNAVDVVMDRCEETVRSTSRNLLCWLKSNHPNISYSKPFTLVKHASSTTKYRSLLKKALAFCFRAYRMDAKQRERLIGVRFNKKLYRFLDAIWHHKGLAHDSLVAGRIAEVEQLHEEAGDDEMHVAYEDMDINENAYGNLMNGEDDDDDDDDGDGNNNDDLYNTSEDNSDDHVYMPISAGILLGIWPMMV
ncbi:hypothetical protein ACKAV7_008701 [Fusarium commune]